VIELLRVEVGVSVASFEVWRSSRKTVGPCANTVMCSYEVIDAAVREVLRRGQSGAALAARKRALITRRFSSVAAAFAAA
jgi:hypothetical protein